jgi:hypothetical protein
MISAASSIVDGSINAAYFDLHSVHGPIHARVASDMGRRLRTGEDIPPYQVVTSSLFRRALAIDHPGTPMIDDPREVPPAGRTAEWQSVCDRLTGAAALDGFERLRLARVLLKLGFWNTICELAESPKDPPDVAWRISFMKHMATEKMRLKDAYSVPPGAYELLCATALDRRHPVRARLGTAINLMVHHARFERSHSAFAYWSEIARDLAQSMDMTGANLVLYSTYWRAASFVPYLQGDVAGTFSMLDQAEAAALAAMTDDAMSGRNLFPIENLAIVWMTRARTAALVRDTSQADVYFRRCIDLDALDSVTNVAFADYLFDLGRVTEASAFYTTAARLGAPATRYAANRVQLCAQIVRR